MKVFVVGTACSWFERRNTSFILDDVMLFDTPEGNYKTILKEIDVFNLDCIFISHFHTDHFADLHIFTTRMIRESKRRNKPKLRVYGPVGIEQKLINHLKFFYGGDDETSPEILEQYVEFIELYDGMQFEEGGYSVMAYKMQHGKPECFGLTFTDKSGKTVAFSADTIICDNLEKMLKKSDFAFVDMASNVPSKTHIEMHDFVGLTEKFKNCKIYPVHTCDKSQEFAEQNGLNFLTDGETLIL